MKVERLTGDAVQDALVDLARLRVKVFRAFPYLYNGDPDNEAHYLRSYRDNPRATLVVARDGETIVGAATAMPLADHGDAGDMQGLTLPTDDVYYCAESVLLPDYRGRGIGHRFFEMREAEARAQGFKHALFAAVIRAPDDPRRPAGYRPLDGFWRKRGYAPLKGVTATFTWTDLGDSRDSPHLLQAWHRQLSP